MSRAYTKVTGKQLHLLVVGVTWPPETFIERRLSTLVGRGLNVTVATASSGGQRRFRIPRVKVVNLPRWDGSTPFTVARLGFSVGALTLGGKAPRVLRLLGRQPRSLAKLAFARSLSYLPLAQLKPDIVHFEWAFAAADFQPLFDIWRCPMVVSCRGSQINTAPHNPLRSDAIRAGLRSTFMRAAAVHCVSEAIKREAAQYGLDPEKAWVIRPAVDPGFFSPGQRNASPHMPCRLVTIGSLVWGKGYEYALLAVRHLLDGGRAVEFDIIGDGPERERVQYTIDDLGIASVVRLHGSVPQEAVRELLRTADIFLLSSLSEGISNAVLEAMACGLPVVSTNCGGMAEAITDGIEGFLVPVRDPLSMAHAIGLLIDDPQTRARMGSAARQRVVNHFTLDKQSEQFLELYDSVLAQR